jgi:hypothetical protein
LTIIRDTAAVRGDSVKAADTFQVKPLSVLL